MCLCHCRLLCTHRRQLALSPYTDRLLLPSARECALIASHSPIATHTVTRRAKVMISP